jgi:hypothetical protein
VIPVGIRLRHDDQGRVFSTSESKLSFALFGKDLEFFDRVTEMTLALARSVKDD